MRLIHLMELWSHISHHTTALSLCLMFTRGYKKLQPPKSRQRVAFYGTTQSNQNVPADQKKQKPNEFPLESGFVASV